MGETLTLPLTSPPVAKKSPAQVVALALDQVTRLEPPELMSCGSTTRVAVTAGRTFTVTLEDALAFPRPVQVRR